MKKLGFTITELILALGVIGVLVAITAPAISNLMPNQEKIKVLKYYKLMNDVSQEMLNDQSLYISEDECVAFYCTQKPINEKYQDDLYKGQSKFGALFVEHVQANTTELTKNSSGAFFYLDDGSYWAFDWSSFDYVDVMVDINGKHNSSDCFFFAIPKNGGQVRGNDPLSVAYIKNASKLNCKKEDYETAKKDNTHYGYRSADERY